MSTDEMNWDEYYGGPSRSQQRREALDVLALAKELVLLSERELDLLPLNESLRTQVDAAIRIKSQIAHKRQVQFLAKQLRKYETELAAIRSALALPKLEARRLNDNLHRAEQWRDRLLAEGDLGLNALLQEFPAGDRQTLRQLMRQAEAEVERQQPPAAARQLFQRLRELLDTKA